MKTKLEKLNNKFVVEIPNEILKKLNIKNNDDLQIDVVDNKLVITDSNTKDLTLEERLDYYSSKNLIKKYDWGKV